MSVFFWYQFMWIVLDKGSLNRLLFWLIITESTNMSCEVLFIVQSRLSTDVQDFKSSFKLCISQGLRSAAQVPDISPFHCFLADRTIGRAYGTVCRLSSVCRL